MRFAHGPDDTLGLLRVDTVFECFTLEDERRAVKVPGETRIPAGVYRVGLQAAGRLHLAYSRRYGSEHVGMLHVEHVPGFTGIMIHAGNVEADTDGCPLVGDELKTNISGRGFLGRSRPAYERLYRKVAPLLESGVRVDLEVRDL